MLIPDLFLSDPTIKSPSITIEDLLTYDSQLVPEKWLQEPWNSKSLQFSVLDLILSSRR